VKLVSCSVLVAVIVMMSTAGPGAQDPGTFTSYGVGAATCASWTEHLKDTNLHARDLQWVLGFASAAGVFAGVQLKVEPDGIAPFITTYCQEHAADTITSAAATMVGKLRR
jgi:hypothetical protein